VFKIKVIDYMKILFFIAVVLSFTGELESFSDTTNLKITENINQGNITLFSQNYSEINNVPNNIFIAKVWNNTTKSENENSKVHEKYKSEILFDNNSKELKYTTTRKSPLYPLYVCDLTPMVKCSYEISMGIKTDDPQSFVELDTPGSKMRIKEIDNKTALNSYFRTDSGNIDSKSIFIGNAKENFSFKIIFDGENKTNTICTEDGNCIVTPFYNLERQKLPYVDFSNGYIKFTSFVMGGGTYLDVDIHTINQKADRKFITSIGNSKMIAFGIDGPHPINTVEQGINYLNSKDSRGTLWFDVRSIDECNETDLEYLKNLVNNDSWETGIHFSKELNNLPLEQAYKTIDEEYTYVYEKIGKKPTSWCSLRNNDNITHAIYAYKKWGMYWRNGDSGVHTEKIVGNLYDNTWEWWEPASYAGMSHPVFTHELDKNPAIKYSISYPKFKIWVDNYYSNNVSIESFYEYSQINRNTYDAYFDNISSNGNIITFNAYTNGIRSLVNVNVTAGSDTQVYDRTSNESLNYILEKDKSITFWVENNHTYNVYLNNTILLH
jgi:hypothetical protein